MSAQLAMRAIVPKGFDIEKYRIRMRKAMDECAKDVRVRMIAWVENWDNRPTNFFITETEDGKGIHRHIFPQPGYGADIWRWVSFGTKGPYPIAGVARSFLYFPENYSPKTAVGGVYGRSATSGPGLVQLKETMHPGITPRYIEGEIIDDYEEIFFTKMAKAHAEGLAAAAQGGKSS